MIARTKALPEPTNGRYWSVDLGERGAHHFRFPYYGTVSSLLAFSGSRSAPGEAPSINKMINALPVFGALLGICWHHRVFKLKTPPIPFEDVGDFDKLSAYGVAVVDELQDDYDLLELATLFNESIDEVRSRYLPAGKSKETKDFS